MGEWREELRPEVTAVASERCLVQIPVITTCGKDGLPDPEEVERL
jgi:hypothetical protein